MERRGVEGEGRRVRGGVGSANSGFFLSVWSSVTLADVVLQTYSIPFNQTARSKVYARGVLSRKK